MSLELVAVDDEDGGELDADAGAGAAAEPLSFAGAMFALAGS